MNKNLENEYKMHIENQIPDLWDRIEKALPEKSNNATTDEGKIVADKVVEFSNSNISNKVNRKNSKAKVISIVSGLAVAMLAGVMIIPVVLNGNGLKTDNIDSARSINAEKNKSDKGSSKKSSNKSSNFLEGIAGLDVAEAPASDATCEEAYDAAEDFDYAADDEYENADAAACEEADTSDMQTNDIKASIDSDMEMAELAFISQYDDDGIMNFDDDNNLVRDIEDIIASGSVFMDVKDLSYAKIKAEYDDDGNKLSEIISLNFRTGSKEKLERATIKSADNNEKIGIFYKDEIVYSAVCIVPIKNGMLDVTGFDPETGLAAEITKFINENND